MKKTLMGIAFLALGLSACAPSDDYVGVCVNSSNVRVSDSNCEDEVVYGYAWYYILASQTMPPVGGRVNTSGANIYRTPPKSASVRRGGVPTKGGSYKPPQAPKPQSTYRAPAPTYRAPAPAPRAPAPR